MKHLAILGSTGSIGKSALSVVATHPDEFGVAGIAANTSVDLMERQIRRFRPRRAALNDKDAADELRNRIRDLKSVELLAGPEGVLAISTMDEVDLVLEGIGGSAGLLPTLEAIRAGKDLAFVNKEVLVMCGSLVMQAVKENDVRLLPVDSEMSAIFQCLSDCEEKSRNRDEVHRLILTASGGPFRHTDIDELGSVIPQEALNHPKWNMGSKISIDSATMLNKGLEVIEAQWLFDIELAKIEVIIHPQSIIHSLVEFVDGSILAQLSATDMRLPIQHALAYPNRLSTPVPRLNLCDIRTLHLEPVDYEKFPCLPLAYTAAEVGGTLPTVLSSADEIVVQAFLDEKIGFMDIPDILGVVMDRHDTELKPSFDDILAADQWAKSTAQELIRKQELAA
ncbi:MAG: 1-deoxy-D-xylulose-5-phosphate reductoisomerase [Candidatus Poribacteria bacterium]|nr:1-deoxy-D-xylulose-5-phosphate reductoisomerase [Candidatus Poribacteria bacterium]